MSDRPQVPSFRFHIPHTGKIVNYEELERMSRRKHCPQKVEVVDASSSGRYNGRDVHATFGTMSIFAALQKFR